MFNDPQFWVAIAFVIFLILIFNPVRKILKSSLDSKINEISKSIDEAENIKTETQEALSGIKKRQNEVEIEIQNIYNEAKERILFIEKSSQIKLKDQIDKKRRPRFSLHEKYVTPGYKCLGIPIYEGDLNM